MQDNIFSYKIPTKLVYGLNAVKEIRKEIDNLGMNKILLVTDKGVHEAGILESIEEEITSSGVDYEIFDDIDFEPTVEIVHRGVDFARKMSYDGIIGVGGGSPLDTAKAIAVLVTNEGTVHDYVGVDKYMNKPLPFIAVPTTAGTGSEATRWSLIVDHEREEKLAIGCWDAMPDVSICDPIMTRTMPVGLTASTGMDALTHSIEAFVNTNCQNISEAMAEKSISLISHNLRQAVANGNNIEARDAMLMGSLTAALAFNVTGITSVHAISHVVGAHLGVPHGIANAILLPHVMEFSLIGAPQRYAQIAQLMGENLEGLSLMESARKSVTAVRSLLEDVGITEGLSDYGLSKVGIDEIDAPKENISRLATEAAGSSSNQLNPRYITSRDIIHILENAL